MIRQNRSRQPTPPLLLQNRTQRSDRERCATGYCHPYLSLQQCRQADQLHRQTELYSRRRTLRDREYHYCRIQGPSTVITDEAGTVSTYTLNDKGYATTCTSQDMAGNTRTYTFSYLINTEDKYYLENITEKLDDGKEYSFITIDYSNFRALRIQQKVDTFEHNSTATTPSAMKLQISPKYQPIHYGHVSAFHACGCHIREDIGRTCKLSDYPTHPGQQRRK